MKEKDKELKFKGKIIRCVYDSEDFKTYAVEVNKDDYSFIKFSKYGSATICGNLHELGIGQNYEIVATEQNTKYGYSYKVVNIRKDKPVSENDIYIFLQEILTFNQASELWLHYPDIVDRVVEGRTNDIDLSKLKGIGVSTFESIKTKIIENYALCDLVAEFNGVLTISMLKKLYDRYPSIQQLKNKLKEDPYKCLCGLSRVGFITADSLLLELEKAEKISFEYDLKTSKQRCLSCMLYLLQENETKNGSTKMDLRELRKQVIKHVPTCANHFVECLKEDDVDIYYNKDNFDVALKSTYEVEKFIADEIISRINNKVIKWNFDIEKYRNVDNISLSDEQMELLSTVCDNNFVVLTAPGGTGKSFSTKALINMFKDNNITFVLASPTGKAAKKLSEYTEEDAKTIHRTLCYMNGEFAYNEENQLITDVVLLDEVGMTDIRLFMNLLKAIPSNTKIVLVGDKFQLNSVGCGALLRDLIDNDNIPQVHYSKVFRMGVGGVLTACTYVRENKKFISANKFTQIGEDKSYSFIPASKDNINNMVVALYKKLIQTNNPKDITVLSSYNIGENGCGKLNKLLQPIANPNAKPNNNECVNITQNKETIHFYKGDSVIANVNNYHAKLYDNSFIYDEKNNPMECMIANGDQGVVVDIINNRALVIDFDGTVVYYDYGELNSIRHAFAISIHRMQGSQNKNIIFCSPSSHMFMLSNNIIYTAISRAEKNVYHFSDEHTLNVAMKKSDSDKRETMLGELLKTN